MSMRYSQGDGVNTSLSSLMYCAHVLVSVYVCRSRVCYIVLPAARSCAAWDNNNKDCLGYSVLDAGLSCTKGDWYVYDWDTGSPIRI